MTEFANEFVERHGEEKAKRLYERLATDEEQEAARRGEHLDPEQGEDAYRERPNDV